MKKTIFYHAGCSVCVSVEQDLMELLKNENVEYVNLNEDISRLEEAKQLGLKSVPALALANGNILHINFGASLEELIKEKI